MSAPSRFSSLSLLLLGSIFLFLSGCVSPVRIIEGPEGVVPPAASLFFEFDTDIFPSDSAKKWITDELVHFDPPIPGAYQWESPRRLKFAPSAPLLPSTDYTAVVKSEILSNRDMKAVFDTLRFHTKYFQAESVAFSWSESERYSLDATAEINIGFSHPVEPYQAIKFIEVWNDGKQLENIQTSGYNETSYLTVYFDGAELKSPTEAIEVRFKQGLPSVHEEAKLREETILANTLAPPGELEIRTVNSEIRDGRLTIEMRSNQKIDPEVLRAYLTITPESDFGLQASGSVTYIQGDFKPGTLLNFKVKKGATGMRGGTLQKEFNYNLLLPDLKPFLRFADGQGKYLMRNGAENLNVKCVNMPAFEAKVYEIYENNLLHFLDRNSYHFNNWNYYSNEDEYYYGYGDDLNLSNFGKLIAVDSFKNDDAEKNEMLNLPVNLQKHLRSRFQGIFAMELCESGENWAKDSKIISLSDLGLIAKKTEDELLVFVNALSTAQPVTGARVKIVSSTNQEILTATTDGNGVARFSDLGRKLSTAMGAFSPRLIIVSSGNDFNFLDLKRSEIHDSRWELPAKSPSTHEVYLYSERNLYRPGDTAHFAAIVRNWDLKPEASLPLLFRVYDPSGDLVVDRKKVTDAQGSFEVEIPLGLGDRTGLYNAEVLSIAENVLQSYSFNLEEFVPDKIKVDLATLHNGKVGKVQALPGDTVLFPLAGQYYFGSNCSDHSYEYRINFSSQSFYSRNFRDFRFPGNEDYLDMDQVESFGKLNLQGRDTIGFPVPKDLKAKGKVSGRIYATVFDNTGHTVSRSKSFDLITEKHFLGIKSAGRYFSVNDNFQMEVAAVDYNDQLSPGLPLVIEVRRLDWKQAMRKRAGQFSYVSEGEPLLVSRDTVVQGSKPHRFQMRIRKAGNYEVTVKSTDPDIKPNSLDFSAYGKEVATASSFGVDREGAITILSDKDKYKTGENARLLFTAPFSGRMLVTIERDKVFEYRYLNVENNSAELILPLRNEQVPNVLVSATLFRPQKTMAALPMTVAHGFTALKVDNPNLELPIRIESPKRIKPGATASIEVRTAARSDIRVTVAVVDEGILAIKRYQTPDPFSFMYAAREATVESFDMYKDLLPEVPSAQSATGGGDGGGGSPGLLNPIQARRYRPVAVWSGILKTDANGRARTQITVPKEFNGEARIMAVAWHNDRFGAGDAALTVKDDVVMMPGVPRFATAGDTLIVPVNLLNTTKKTGNASVTIETEGPLKVIGTASQELSLDSEGSATGTFRMVASNEIGVAKLRFVLSGMETATHDIELAVRPPSPLESESGAGSIAAGSKATIKVPAGYYPQLHRTSFRISNLPAMKFADHLEYLLRYPHGCVEQTTSAVFPQLYFAELAEIIAPDLYKNSNAVHHVREGIRKLESMQLYNGGFSYWPGGGYGSRWSSVYVTHFLLEARKAGFSVNESTLENALGYLKSFASEKATFQYVYYRDTRRFEAVKAEKELIYALYVLALGKQADLPLMNYYKNHPELLTGDTRYLLAASFAQKGDMGSFETLMPRNWEPEGSDRLTGGSFDSPARANAMMLSALVDADPSHPFVEMIIQYLSDHADEIYSTQDRAWTFLALGKAIKGNAGNSPQVEILVDGKAVRTFEGQNANLNDLDLMGKTITLQAKAGAKGKAWYSWRIDGIRSGGGVKTKDRDNGLKIRRKYFSTDGREYLQPHFKQGELVICRLDLSAEKKAENVAIMDLIPAGFEIENMRLSQGNFNWIKGLGKSDYMDARDDRAIYYTGIEAGKKQRFTYLCRVVNQGTFLLPPLGAEAMYDPKLNSFVSGDTVYVYPPDTEFPDSRLGPKPKADPSDPGNGEPGTAPARAGLWTQIRNQIEL